MAEVEPPKKGFNERLFAKLIRKPDSHQYVVER